MQQFYKQQLAAGFLREGPYLHTGIVNVKQQKVQQKVITIRINFTDNYTKRNGLLV
jgi:hypothetical protein